MKIVDYFLLLGMSVFCGVMYSLIIETLIQVTIGYQVNPALFYVSVATITLIAYTSMRIVKYDVNYPTSVPVRRQMP